MLSLRNRLLLGLLLLTALVPLLAALLDGRRAAPVPAPENSPPQPSPRVLTGADVLAREGAARLRGKRVGLITNQTGRTADGRRTIDVLAQAEGVKLVALFSPEHGPEGTLTGTVADAADAATGLRIYSLYGKTRRPTADMLEGLDVLVFDIQDAGVRYYTYITTMAYAMEEAARLGIEFVVLDRPNPLGGEGVEGPMLDPDRVNFEGYFPLPLRYGMTLGELAQLFNQTNEIGARLTVVRLEEWRRAQWFDDTGLDWIPPSPNLKTLAGVKFYPAVELLRAGDVSVGRGTDAPFEQFGAPWMDGGKVAAYLEARAVPGVRFTVVEFTPATDVHAGKLCRGVRLELTDRDALPIGRLGMELISALGRLYPNDFRLDATIRLVGSKKTIERLQAGDDPVDIVAGWREELAAFRKLRERYLLYE